ncbi:MAG: hypothetical protein NC181_02520 [Clostridium sp.]|nr:hypothetical protein [Clostridium sp.]MCM1444165.1 hypothetical protein [Candidatus Amulumruptor caecigallinarius]
MKKSLIILILLVLNITIYISKSKTMEVGIIDLNLNENDKAFTLLSLENSKSILINNQDLLLLEYIDSTDIEKSLKLYGIDILNNLILTSPTTINIKSYNKQTLNHNINISNINVIKKDNIILMDYYNYRFCIYKSGKEKDLESCDFIYFLSIDNVDFSDNILAVFFDLGIEKEKIERYYDKWVDSYILKENSFYTLKLSKNFYDVIEVPLN